MKPQKFNVRLYIIKTHKLLPPQGVQPKDLNPYFKVRRDGPSRTSLLLIHPSAPPSHWLGAALFLCRKPRR